MLFSIVIACFNAARTLPAAVASIAAQRRDDVELIIIDGNSTDDTRDVIARNELGISYWLIESDTGVYNAWNKGLAAARGQYIGFLGADDILLPGALDAYACLSAAQPDAEFLSARVRYGGGLHARVVGQPWEWHRFRRYMSVAHVASMHRRSLFERLGSYDESFAITGDYEFLLRAGSTLRTAFMSDITAQMGLGGISSGRSKRVFDETMRAKRLHAGLTEPVLFADRWKAVAKHRVRGLFHS